MLNDLAVVIDDPGAGTFLADNWKGLVGAGILAGLFMYFRKMTIGKIAGAGVVVVILAILLPEFIKGA